MKEKEVNPSELVLRYGTNTNSFLTLYDDYRYFTSPNTEGDAMLAYIETRYAWVGAAEPMADPRDWCLLLRDFAEAASSLGKVAMCLPVGRDTAEKARALGFDAVKIGSEPLFWLDRYLPEVDRISTARRVQAKGASVREVKLEALSPCEKAELDKMVAEWLASRKMSKLGFLNRVEPWAWSQSKKYFVAELDGRKLAFLATVPISPRDGWYFVDLFRWQDSPPGSTELLMLESMRILKGQGARLISLGVAPLSGLGPEDDGNYPRLNRLLRFTYEHGNLFYNFKSLHQFKLKFEPSGSEAAYLIFCPGRLAGRHVVALLDTFLGAGIPTALWSGMDRAASRFHPGDWIRHYLVPGLVVRAKSSTSTGGLARCGLTLALFFINFVFYLFLVSATGRPGTSYLARYAFSMETVTRGDLRTIVLSPFLHWNSVHLATNLFSMLAFCTGLEYLAGTRFLLVCYGAGALLSNLLTCSLVFFPLAWLNPSSQIYLASLRDVGASVGILAALGGLGVFFRRGHWPLIAAASGILGYTLVTEDYFAVNHLFGMLLGNLAARLLLRQWRI